MTTCARDSTKPPWLAAPIFRVGRLVAGTPVEVTTVGGAPQVAERAVDSLTERLRRWDLGNDEGPLSRVWHGHDLVEVDDETLLLLALTTNATVDLSAGAAYVPVGQEAPQLALTRALALDMTMQELQDEDVAGVGIAVGNDVLVRGTSPLGRGWGVQLAGPDHTTNVYLSEGACVSVAANPPEHLTAITVHALTAWQAASIAAAALSLTVADAGRLVADAGATARLHTPGGISDVGTWRLAGRFTAC